MPQLDPLRNRVEKQVFPGEETDDEAESQRPRKWMPKKMNKKDAKLMHTFRERLQALSRWEKPNYCPMLKPVLFDFVMENFQAQTTPPNSLTVVAVGASGGVELDKAALIRKYIDQWPTINRDFQDANENSLSNAAKAPGHGEWFEAAALNWADQRGKYTKEKQQGPANSVFNLATGV